MRRDTNLTRPPALTRRDIKNGLQQLGLQRGDVVEVHSSLSSLGYVEGGAPSVIAALMDVIGEEGAIVMSAYPVSPALPLTTEEKARGITWKVRIFEEGTDEKTGMGVIADAFRRWPGVCCGSGIHRVCAWGRDARIHCERGYAYLLELDGWALLIGVGYDRLSSLHQAERIGFPEAVSRCFRIPDDIRKDYPAETWAVGFGSTPHDAWSKVWQEARLGGLVKEGYIGQARCFLTKARPVVAIYERWLRTDPYELFGLTKDERFEI